MSDAHIAGQADFEAETAPHEENFVSSRRKFCFIAKKILFHREENFVLSRRNKIRLLGEGKTCAVNCPRTDGAGRTAVGGYVRKLYLRTFFFSRRLLQTLASRFALAYPSVLKRCFPPTGGELRFVRFV